MQEYIVRVSTVSPVGEGHPMETNVTTSFGWEYLFSQAFVYLYNLFCNVVYSIYTDL